MKALAGRTFLPRIVQFTNENDKNIASNSNAFRKKFLGN